MMDKPTVIFFHENAGSSTIDNKLETWAADYNILISTIIWWVAIFLLLPIEAMGKVVALQLNKESKRTP
jgi:hypothetical protein